MIASSKKVLNALKKGAARIPLLRDDNSGLALTEFAFAMPIVLSLGMLGTEVANYTVTHMRISQVAVQLADNASRVGSEEVLQARQVTEADITEVFVGAWRLGGGLDILDNGRVVLSSLQQNSDDGQWIAWQRCMGQKNVASTYGVEGDGATGTAFPGMGEPGREITASPGTAVMFVEVFYDYPGLTPFDEIISNKQIRYTAAFNVRDVRDLAQLFPVDDVTPATCDRFDTF